MDTSSYPTYLDHENNEPNDLPWVGDDPDMDEPEEEYYEEDERVRQAYGEDFGWQDESHMNDALDEFMCGLDQ